MKVGCLIEKDNQFADGLFVFPGTEWTGSGKDIVFSAPHLVTVPGRILLLDQPWIP